MERFWSGSEAVEPHAPLRPSPAPLLAQELLAPILLRRMKEDVEKLPEKVR